MAVTLLLISDIHANFPALEAVEDFFGDRRLDLIVNCGDSVVYGPFPNETLAWLTEKKALTILGNTDKKVIRLLRGKTFAKPASPEKRIMYTWTAEALEHQHRQLLMSFPKKDTFTLASGKWGLPQEWKIGVFHGSPAKNHEFLFADTAEKRFRQLAAQTEADIVVCGHSHDAFHRHIAGVHFINPGSVGRMFDGDPRASCAIIHFDEQGPTVRHYRIAYAVDRTVTALRRAALPEIYCRMYETGKKLN